MSDLGDGDPVPAGEPIHRRTLEVHLGAEEAGRRDLRAQIVDRRLHGFTVAGAQGIVSGNVSENVNMVSIQYSYSF